MRGSGRSMPRLAGALAKCGEHLGAALSPPPTACSGVRLPPAGRPVRQLVLDHLAVKLRLVTSPGKRPHGQVALPVPVDGEPRRIGQHYGHAAPPGGRDPIIRTAGYPWRPAILARGSPGAGPRHRFTSHDATPQDATSLRKAWRTLKGQHRPGCSAYGPRFAPGERSAWIIQLGRGRAAARARSACGRRPSRSVRIAGRGRRARSADLYYQGAPSAG